MNPLSFIGNLFCTTHCTWPPWIESTVCLVFLALLLHEWTVCLVSILGPATIWMDCVFSILGPATPRTQTIRLSYCSTCLCYLPTSHSSFLARVGGGTTIFFFWDKVLLCTPGFPGTHSAVQAGFKLSDLHDFASRVLGLRCLPSCLTSTLFFGFFTRSLKKIYSHIFLNLLITNICHEVYVTPLFVNSTLLNVTINFIWPSSGTWLVKLFFRLSLDFVLGISFFQC